MVRLGFARLLFGFVVALLLCVIGYNVARRSHHASPADPAEADEQLDWAARSGDTNAINALIRRRVNVNEITGLHSSALSTALRYNQFEAAKLLIENGANVKASRLGTWPPLVDAAASCPQAVPLLLGKGAPVNTANIRGETPLLAAFENPQQNEIVPILLSHGADVNAKTAEGETVLMRAVRTSNVALVKTLLQRGVDVNAGTNEGVTALMNVTTPEMANLLIAHGAQVNARTRRGVTPLMAASNSQIARVLLAHGADCNAKTVDGMTATMVTYNPGVVRALIQYHADANCTDEKGHSALYYAFKRHDIACAMELVNGGAHSEERMVDGQTLLQEAIYLGNADLVRAMVKHGADLTEKGDFNGTPLQTATKMKRPDIIQVLKKAAAKE